MSAPASPGKRPLTEETTRYARLVGRVIAARRRRMGISQAALAAAVTAAGYRISDLTVGSIEGGYTGGQANRRYSNVSVDQLMAFARALNCAPMDFFSEPCTTCAGIPPAGFTCNDCGTTTKEA